VASAIAGSTGAVGVFGSLGVLAVGGVTVEVDVPVVAVPGASPPPQATNSVATATAAIQFVVDLIASP
jgi:hypothetical protein